MKKISINLFASVSLIITMTSASTPLAGHAALEVVVWGPFGANEGTLPSGLSNVVGIATGADHSLALTAEGRVMAWSQYSVAQAKVPSGLSNAVGIAAGAYHSLALTAEGRVVGWGDNGAGQTTVPSGLGNVVAIAGGANHSLALMAEGRMAAWGNNDYGQRNVPSGLSNVVGIAAGGIEDWIPAPNSLALFGLPPGVASPAWVGPRFLMGAVDRPFQHRIMAKNGVTAYGAAGLPSGLVLDPGTGLITGQPAQAGKYVVVFSATNGVGSCAWPVTLFVNRSAVPAIGSSGLVQIGLGCGFSYAVVAYNAPEWYGASRLPAGLVIDAQSGVISGVPVEVGDYVVSLVASNHSGLGTGSLTLRVSPVVAWGDNGSALPSGLSNVMAIATGRFHSLALTAEGRVVAWPAGSPETTVPSGLSNVVAIAAGGAAFSGIHCLALLQQPTVPTPRLALSRGMSGLELQAQGAPGISCQLLRASVLPGPWLPAEPVTFTNSVQMLRPPDTSEPAQFFRLLRK